MAQTRSSVEILVSLLGQNDVQTGLLNLQRTFSNLASVVKGFFGVAVGAGAFRALVVEGVRYNAILEQQLVAFRTLLGTAEAAETRIRDLVRFAANTPYQLEEITKASKLLQAFTGEALSAGNGLRLVGDAAAAVGAPLESVAMWMGRLYSALRGGLPIGEALQNLSNLGLISAETRLELTSLQGTAMSSAEAFAALESAFSKMSGAMELQSQTLSGRLSTLRDAFKALAGSATESIAEQNSEFVAALTNLVDALNPDIERSLEGRIRAMEESRKDRGVFEPSKFERRLRAELEKLRTTGRLDISNASAFAEHTADRAFSDPINVRAREAQEAMQEAVDLANGLLERRSAILTTYQKEVEGLDDREARLKKEKEAASANLAEDEQKLLLLEDREKAESAMALARQEHAAIEVSINKQLESIAESRAKAEEKVSLESARAAKEDAAILEKARQLELAREELQLSQQLGVLARERSRIENDRMLTDEDRRRTVLPLLDQELILLENKLQKTEALIAAEEDGFRRLEIERERLRIEEQISAAIAQRERERPLSFREEIGAGIIEIADEIGTTTQAAANVFIGPLRAAIEGARKSLQGLLGDTDYWTQKLGTVPGMIAGSITESISHLFASWIANRVKQSAVHLGLVAAEGSAEAVAKTPGALLASISSFGTAAVAGLAALTTAMASVGGFRTGGYTGDGSPYEIAGVTHKREFVFSAPAVERLGRKRLELLHREAVTPSSGSKPATVPPDVQAIAPIANPNLEASVHVGIMNISSEFRRFNRREGHKAAYDYARRRQV